MLTKAPEGLGFDASIIIVSFNTRQILRECLESVIRESTGLSIEIFVVDNNSHDGSTQMVRECFSQVKLLESDINLGFGAANNIALQQASGRYYVLLNSDAFFQEGALKRAIEHMDAQPDCGLGGSRLIGRDGSWQPSSRSFHSIVHDLVVLTGLAGKFPKSRFFGHFDRTWANDDEPASVDWVPGAFSIIRPSALAKTGLFDPAFFLYYEEVDLCRRIKQAGFSVWYWPDIIVVHIGGESSRQLKKKLEFSSMTAQVVMWRMRSTLLYYRKHHGPQVYMAKWSELAMYRLTVARNRWSRASVRKQRGEDYRVLISLMNQAWKDTQGGRVSPPRPW
ncbi:MAG: glycosyltransferase family 2 protein [Edaphobacter sp.]|uniref:glycosyltransferase family 2 protein n=1 Tax=Edaphobacter sp. TaxID=1934404 RepID=UPI002386984F|nr:glycosyltransferase family 2 protein [Edaphobacter sp.]MDE1175200.1 glycosyltransferase family 2 protein [Edaphobacter sp.]